MCVVYVACVSVCIKLFPAYGPHRKSCYSHKDGQ